MRAVIVFIYHYIRLLREQVEHIFIFGVKYIIYSFSAHINLLHLLLLSAFVVAGWNFFLHMATGTRTHNERRTAGNPTDTAEADLAPGVLWEDADPTPPPPSRAEFQSLTERFEGLTAQISNLSTGLRNFTEVQERQASFAPAGAARFYGGPLGPVPGLPSPFRDRQRQRSSSESGSSRNSRNSSPASTRGVGLQTDNIDTNTSGVPPKPGSSGGPPPLKKGRLSSTHNSSNCEHLFSTLRSNLYALQEEGKIKSRDTHELKVLSSISEAASLDEVHKLVNERLAELYIAATRSWTEVRNYQRRDIDAILDLPPIQQQVIVKSGPPARHYGNGGGKKFKKKSEKKVKS